MASQMKKTKKQRAHKVSQGKNAGGGRVRNLTEIQKVLMNKGLMAVNR